MKSADIVLDLGYGFSGKASVIDYLAGRHESVLGVKFNGGVYYGGTVTREERNPIRLNYFSAGSLSGANSLVLNSVPIDLNSLHKDFSALGSYSVKKSINIHEHCVIVTKIDKLIGAARLAVWAADNSPYKNASDADVSMAITHHAADDLFRAKHMQSTESIDDALLKCQERATAYIKAMINYELAIKRKTVVSALKNILKAVSSKEAVLSDASAIRWFMDRYGKRIKIVSNSAAFKLLNAHDHCIFESRGGTLVDNQVGLFDKSVYRTADLSPLRLLLTEDVKVTKIGITRPIMVRQTQKKSIGDFDHSRNLRQLLNIKNDQQAGCFDLIAIKYALERLSKVDYVFMTHVDCLDNMSEVPVCASYVDPVTRKDLRMQDEIERVDSKGRFLAEAVIKLTYSRIFIPKIEKILDAPVGGISFGPLKNQKMLFY